MIKLLFELAFMLFACCQVSDRDIQNKECETHFSELLQLCTSELAERCFIHIKKWVLGCLCTMMEGCFIRLSRCCLLRAGAPTESHGTSC